MLIVTSGAGRPGATHTSLCCCDSCLPGNCSVEDVLALPGHPHCPMGPVAVTVVLSVTDGHASASTNHDNTPYNGNSWEEKIESR